MTPRRDRRGRSAQHGSDLSRLELALRNLESTWLFLERGDRSLVTDDGTSEGAVRCPRSSRCGSWRPRRPSGHGWRRRSTTGPPRRCPTRSSRSSTSQRVLGPRRRLASTELHPLRELLRRELGDVRSFISQLRPPVLTELGLDGSIVDAVETIGASLVGSPSPRTCGRQRWMLGRCGADRGPSGRPGSTAECPQARDGDARPRSAPALDGGRSGSSRCAMTAAASTSEAVAARGRRNFGLQFMRERAERSEPGSKYDRGPMGAPPSASRPRPPYREKGDRMSADYRGQDRRRGGPDRRGRDDLTRILIVDDHALFRVGIATSSIGRPTSTWSARPTTRAAPSTAALETSPGRRPHGSLAAAPGGIETSHGSSESSPSTAIIVLAVRRGRGRPVRRHQGGRRGVHPQGRRPGRPASRSSAAS